MSEDVLAGRDVGTRVVRGGALRVAAFGGGNLLMAVASLFLLRYLGPVDFGRYGTVMALVAIVAGITDAGLTITGTRELSVRSAGAQRRELLGTIIAMRFVLSVVGVALAVGFAVVVGYDSAMVLGTLVAGAGTLLVALQGSLALPLGVELRNGALAALEVVRQAILALGVVVLVVVGAGLVEFLALQIPAGLGALVLVCVLVGRSGMTMPRFDGAAWRELAVRALPVAIASVLGVLYFRILVLMSSNLTSELQNGYFVTSARILELMAALPVLLTGVALPVASVAAKQDRERLRYVLQRMTEVAALLGVFTAVMLVFLAEPVIVLLGGEEYRPAAPVLRIQGLAMITIFLIQAWVVALVALEAQRLMAWATLSGVIAVLLCGAILIPLADARGAAAATALADALLAVAMLIALRRAGPGREIRWGFGLRVLLAAAIALTPVLIGGLPDVAAGALAAALYTAAAFALRIVPSEIIDAARRR